jgi:hypothetical protein
MSLDGYIADPNDFLGGDDGERLHKWADANGAWPANSSTNGTRPVRSSRGGGLPSSWITGAVITAVSVRGAYTAQRALEAGVLDEVQIHQIPVLLGQGRRLFDELPSLIELEIVRVIDTPEATHIRYRVRR